MTAPKPCNCPKCGEHFESISAMDRHRIEIHGRGKNIRKLDGWECPICHVVFKTCRERDQHRIHIHGKYCYQRTRHGVSHASDWVCQYCGYRCNTRRLLFDHYKSCAKKQQQPVDVLGRPINPNRVIKCKETKQQRMALGLYKPRIVSDQTRQKISVARKQYLAAHHVKYNWMGPLKHLSYAEQYFYDIVHAKCQSVHWANNYRVSYYKLDFANLDTKVYFEVDGEQHYDEYGLMHDADRTKKLADRGWFLIARVRWKHFCNLSQLQKDEYVETLINQFMSNSTNTLQVLPEIKLTSSDSKKASIPLAEYKALRKAKAIERDRQRQLVYQQKRMEAQREGLIRSDGYISGTGTPLSEWNRRKDLILTCGVDLTQFGWVEKVIKCTGLSKRMIENTLSKFPDDFDGKYFRRKWNPVDHKT